MKSATDLHWDQRALAESDTNAVNIADQTQRELETEFILENLPASGRTLEIGCGNGFLTNILRSHTSSVDAFDYSENMIEEAKRLHGETNNRFFHDNVLSPSRTNAPYDTVVCVRVLINLRDTDEQIHALRNIAHLVKPSGGRLILIEGFLDGFAALNALRVKCGLNELKPAAINFYTHLAQIMPVLDQYFITEGTFHCGAFDYLTRVIYPILVGAQNATGHSDFHRRIREVASAFNPAAFEHLSRLRGFSLLRK